MSQQLLVPDIGDFDEVEVIEVLVKVSDKIKKNDPIVTLESDKSSVEVPSTFEGTVESINVKVGDKVSKGHLLVTLNSETQTQEIPKKNIEEKLPTDTENIIKEAEDTLVLKKEVKETKILPQKKNKNEKIEIVKNGDIDPIETKEWLESLSAVLEKDGKKRGILEMPINSKELMVIKKSKEIDNVAKHMRNTSIIKNIYIKNKIVNFITKK